MSTIARLSLAEYDRMVETGVFDQGQRRRLEFIQGEIREMAPIGSLHEEVVDRLTEWSFRELPEGKVRVRVQNSIGLPELESAPQPDLAWVGRRDYTQGRPVASDVLLVIEVAESSLAYDCGEKADLYAAAGIKDYWVVNLPDRSIEVRRDSGTGRYRSLQTYTGDDEVRPLAMPEIAIRPSALWGS
ncbi:MAG: Uma2 family endonuclease [Planctomycetota bacterium]